MTADPNDADYRFNLAVALYKNGDNTGAARQLKDELQRRPNDSEAKSLLDIINRGVTTASPALGNAADSMRAPGDQIARSDGAHQAQLR